MTALTTFERNQRQEAARAARREEILVAARRIFAERGFRGTTIADIADAAGIALGTVYLYFKSKEDVFAALSQRLGQHITDALTVGRPDEDNDTLDAAVRTRVNNVFEVCSANRDLVRLFVLNTDPESAVTHRLKTDEKDRARPLSDAMHEAAKNGWIRAGDPHVMARLIIGLVTMAVYQAYVVSDGVGAEKLRDASCDMIISYLRPEAAVEG